MLDILCKWNVLNIFIVYFNIFLSIAYLYNCIISASYKTMDGPRKGLLGNINHEMATWQYLVPFVFHTIAKQTSQHQILVSDPTLPQPFK